MLSTLSLALASILLVAVTGTLPLSSVVGLPLGTSVQVQGYVLAPSGTLQASYGVLSLSLYDGTGGILVALNGTQKFDAGARVVARGKVSNIYGTRVLNETTVEIVHTSAPHARNPLVFGPTAIGQLNAVCNCTDPVSFTEGLPLTVRGLAVKDLEQDGVYGWKLFLDAGEGMGQVFIDAKSLVDVEQLTPLLKAGKDICVSGVVAHFDGVGYEILPSVTADIRAADGAHPLSPCAAANPKPDVTGPEGWVCIVAGGVAALLAGILGVIVGKCCCRAASRGHSLGDPLL